MLHVHNSSLHRQGLPLHGHDTVRRRWNARGAGELLAESVRDPNHNFTRKENCIKAFLSYIIDNSLGLAFQRM
jgi:hypothetical protein